MPIGFLEVSLLFLNYIFLVASVLNDYRKNRAGKVAEAFLGCFNTFTFTALVFALIWFVPWLGIKIELTSISAVILILALYYFWRFHNSGRPIPGFQSLTFLLFLFALAQQMYYIHTSVNLAKINSLLSAIFGAGFAVIIYVGLAFGAVVRRIFGAPQEEKELTTNLTLLTDRDFDRNFGRASFKLIPSNMAGGIVAYSLLMMMLLIVFAVLL